MAARATTTDLTRLGLPAGALTNVPSPSQQAALDAASAKVDTYLRSRHELPLVQPYPEEIIEAECVLAGWTILTTKGHNPIGFDETFQTRYNMTIRWLEQLASGAVHLAETADSSPNENEGAPQTNSRGPTATYSGTIETNTPRGW